MKFLEIIENITLKNIGKESNGLDESEIFGA